MIHRISREGRRRALAILAIHCLMALAVAPLWAQDAFIRGTLQYTGRLSPIDERQPLCLCVFRDRDLNRHYGCQLFPSATATYEFSTFDDEPYYLIAFIDTRINEMLDPDEPFEIYNNRTEIPGDGVVGSTEARSIDIIFGDLVPTPTPTPVPCIGDCDGSRLVSIHELLGLIQDILRSDAAPSCAASFAGSEVAVTAVVAAVNNVGTTCDF